MKRRLLKILVLCLCVLILCTSVLCASPTDEGVAENKYLMFDHRLVQSVENAELSVTQLEKDTQNNPLVEWDRRYSWAAEKAPIWEGSSNLLYPYVIYDEDYQGGMWRMWYIVIYDNSQMWCRIIADPTGSNYASGNHIVCYQESADGIEWTRPDCDAYYWKNDDGTFIKTNIVYVGNHGTGIYKNDNPNAPTNQAYILAVGTQSYIEIAFSSDGIHWGETQRVKDNKDDEGNFLWPFNMKADTCNNVIWSEVLGQYVYITRGFGNGTEDLIDKKRTVVCLYSDDLINWSDPVEVLHNNGQDLCGEPYIVRMAEYDGYYIGIASMYHPTDWAKDIPFDTDARARKVWGELVYSLDLVNWYYVNAGDDFIPNGNTLVDTGNITHTPNYQESDIDYGCIYASSFVVKDGKIQVYYQCCTDLHTDKSEQTVTIDSDGNSVVSGITNYEAGYYKPYMARGYIELDKFSGYHVTEGSASGTVTTAPFVVNGNNLNLVTDGTVTVTVCNEQGNAIAGLTDRYPSDLNLASINGQTVTLKINLNSSDAAVYAISGGLELLDDTEVSLVEENLTIAVQASHQLTVKIEPATAYNLSDLIFTSDAPTVASVDAQGMITGVSPGTTTIHMKTKDEKFSDSVTVKIINDGFYCSFETEVKYDGSADDWDSSWKKTNERITTVAHTGQYSFGVENNTSKEFYGMRKTMTNAVTTGKMVSVWFYDDVTQNAQRTYLRADGTNSKFVGIGLSPNDNIHYSIFDGDAKINTSSGITRTTGWHQFSIVPTASGVEFLIDGNYVYTSTVINNISKIYLAWWDSVTSSSFAWDDIAVLNYIAVSGVQFLSP